MGQVEKGLLEDFGQLDVLAGSGVELWKGCVVKPLAISQANGWIRGNVELVFLERARAAAQERFEAFMAGDDGSDVEKRAAEASAYAASRLVYFEALKERVRGYFELLGMAVDLDGLSWGQVLAAYDVMVTLTDPTGAGALLRASALREQTRMMNGIRKPK